MKNRLHKQFFH